MQPAPDRNDLTRRERRKLEVRNRILEAAIALFDDQGFSDTKVAEICERADVAHKTFFNHFPSKQHLLQEIAGYAMGQFLGRIEEVRKRPVSTRERIHGLFEMFADRAEEAGTMRPELLHEIIRVAHDASAENQTARQLHDAFAAIVADGVAAGDVAPHHDPETLTEMLMGAFYAVMLNWTNFEGYPFRERAMAAARFLGDAISQEPAGESR